MAAPLMLLDTASLYFRAFFGVPDSFRAPDGTPVNAVRGLLDMITRLVVDHQPGTVVACWDDDWRPAWRVDLVPSYKAHRVAEPVAAEAAGVSSGSAADVADPATPPVTVPVAEETPDSLSVQVPIIAATLTALGLPPVGLAGFEADDVIGTLTEQATGPVDVVTGDRDLFQLVDDGLSRRVLYTARGIRNLQPVTDTWLREKYGITGRQYADFATLRGDASDGLPGVAGVGEKTASRWVAELGGLDDIMAAAADPADKRLTARQRTAVSDAGDYLVRAARVVRVVTDLPVAVPDADMDAAACESIAERYGLSGPMGRARKALAKR